MTEFTLTILAACLEVGLPIALLIGCVLVPRIRPRAWVVLGAVTPFEVFYAIIAASHLVLARPDARWAFHAMWIMSVIPFVASALIGAVLAFSPRPRHGAARYMLGFVAPGLLAALAAVA